MVERDFLEPALLALGFVLAGFLAGLAVLMVLDWKRVRKMGAACGVATGGGVHHLTCSQLRIWLSTGRAMGMAVRGLSGSRRCTASVVATTSGVL